MANPNPAAALLNQPPPTATRKSVTGFVTKLVGDGATYGFINDEIFFQQTNVADGPAGVNDRVFADCEYSEHLPIKWNATSIKILNRASNSSAAAAASAPGGQQPAPNPACNILESDPRRQSRQGMLLSQQQQQQQQPQQQAPPAPVPQMQQVAPPAFAPAVPTTVANSYQQHRQQKQQQQHQHLQHDVNIHQPQPPPQQQMQPQLPMGMMDPTMNRAPDFFSPFNQPPPPQAMAQHPVDLQPFGQHESPMGPPKLEYTSQLGSAFVQNQFMPGPMLPQQPPQPMLPQQLPQQQQQQQRPPHQQNQQNLRNQNMNSSNNNNNMNNNSNNNNKGRFNDNNKNNDRNQMNRGRNRNDKFEQSRVNERENSNSRQSRNSRERSSGRVDGANNKPVGGSNLKLDNSNSRQSPQSHTARSTASISSDRGHNKSSSSSSSSKRYEPYNIPKSAILHDMNSWNMRSRCSSAIHVPSDLKNVIVNQYLRLDVKNTPKPLKFKIESSNLEDKKENESNDETTTATKKVDVASGDDDQAGVKKVEAPASDSGASEESSQTQVNKKDSDQVSTPPSSKSDTRLNHKYGVKVVLISLPELEDIYKKVFGPELNSFTTDNKSHPRLDEAIEMLCNRGPNGGHSLIGGKFDPTIDGFMEGEVNEFERHGRQPDLIATCKRVVLEQAGLDLGPCQGWTLVSTFIYNNRSDYFSSKASIEYSYIYMPHIWTLSDFNLDDSLMEKESLMVNVSSIPQELDVTMTEENAGADTAATAACAADASQADNSAKEEEVLASNATVTIESVVATTPIDNVHATPAEEPGLSVENLSELKVADLKVELDKRGVVYKPNLKKADLVALLQANLSSSSQNTTDSSATNVDTKEPDGAASPLIGGDQVDPTDQLEEGEVATEEDTPDQSEENTIDASDAQAAMAGESRGVKSELSGTLKRKVDEVAGESGDQQQGGEEDGGEATTKKKKIKEDLGEGAAESCRKGSEKVDLIKEPFVVRARKGGQQLATVSLYDVAQVSRYDQFELSVVSHILKEALIQHLSEYIFTSLVEENRSRPQAAAASASASAAAACDTSSTTSSSTGTSNSQEINNSTSDTNNNNNNSSRNQAKLEEGQVAKEYPIDRYITLAFSYFDSTHKGYLHADDLSKLLHNTGITISKRALMSLLGDSDKFNYRTLADLSPVKFAPTYVYKFPDQFNRLPNSSTLSEDNQQQTGDQQSSSSSSGRTVEYQGVRYDVEKLIQQVREAETMRVTMVERFNHAIENYDKQAEEIHVLEVSRMSLSKSIKSINDELSEVRRCREVAEKKLNSLKAKLEAMLTEIQ